MQAMEKCIFSLATQAQLLQECLSNKSLWSVFIQTYRVHASQKRPKKYGATVPLSIVFYRLKRKISGIKWNFFPAFTTLDGHLGTGVIWVKTWSYKMLKMSVWRTWDREGWSLLWEESWSPLARLSSLQKRRIKVPTVNQMIFKQGCGSGPFCRIRNILPDPYPDSTLAM